MTLRHSLKERRPFRAVVAWIGPTMERTMEEACFPTLCSGRVSQSGAQWRMMPGLKDSISVRICEGLVMLVLTCG